MCPRMQIMQSDICCSNGSCASDDLYKGISALTKSMANVSKAAFMPAIRYILVAPRFLEPSFCGSRVLNTLADIFAPVIEQVK